MSQESPASSRKGAIEPDSILEFANLYFSFLICYIYIKMNVNDNDETDLVTLAFKLIKHYNFHRKQITPEKIRHFRNYI